MGGRSSWITPAKFHSTRKRISLASDPSKQHTSVNPPRLSGLRPDWSIGGEVAGAAIGIGAAIAVAIILPIEISRSHHIPTGCGMSSANGLDLQTSDGKTYALEGDAATIKAGDKVKLHGSKIKKNKDSTGPGVFRVEKLTRDYGACPVASNSSSPAH